MVAREDAPVLELVLRTDQGCTAATLEDVEIDTVTAQGELFGSLHLGHHLHGVTAYRQAAHREVEAAVGRTAACHGDSVLLLAVHIERHDLGTRTAHGIGDAHGVVGPIAATDDGVGEVVAALQG